MNPQGFPSHPSSPTQSLPAWLELLYDLILVAAVLGFAYFFFWWFVLLVGPALLISLALMVVESTVR